MNKVYEKPKLIPEDLSNSWCPGCGHGTIHKLIANTIDTYRMKEETIMISPVGCGTMNTATGWFDCNSVACAHGRASAAAYAIKKCYPDRLVFAYQGDGDLASIGMAETIHTANRGGNLTIIFVNNGNFGMTGGQMAPTSLIGQRTTTSQEGRNFKDHGNPIGVCELIATLEMPKYVVRVSLHDAKHVIQTQKAIEKAFRMQSEGKGFSFVEVLSPCPTNWKMSPVESMKHINDVVIKTYPLGVFKEDK